MEDDVMEETKFKRKKVRKASVCIRLRIKHLKINFIKQFKVRIYDVVT